VAAVEIEDGIGTEAPGARFQHIQIAAAAAVGIEQLVHHTVAAVGTADVSEMTHTGAAVESCHYSRIVVAAAVGEGGLGGAAAAKRRI